MGGWGRDLVLVDSAQSPLSEVRGEGEGGEGRADLSPELGPPAGPRKASVYLAAFLWLVYVC